MNRFTKIFVICALAFAFLVSGSLNGFASSISTSNVSNTVSFSAAGYEITYYLDGGQNNYSNPTFYKKEYATITLQNPTKTDYTFVGWYGNPSFTGDPITEIVSGTEGNILLYAKWTLEYSELLAFTLSADQSYYSVSDATLPITVTKIVVPNEYNGIPVTELDMAGFRDNTNIQSVYIEDGIVAMGSHVFRDCANLSTIILPNTLLEIPIHAFNGCASLTALIVPRSISQGGITTGAAQMLANTPATFKIFVPNDSIDEYKAEFSWSAYASKIYSMDMIYGDYAVVDVPGGVSIFQYIGTSDSLSVPTIINGKSVVAIGAHSFTLNKIVTRILLQSPITSIGEGAFYGCTNLLLLGVSRAVGETITSAGLTILTGTSTALTILVPLDSVNAYKTATNWSGYSTSITAATGGTSGFIYSDITNGIVLLKYVGEETNLVIPSSIDSKTVLAIGSFLLSSAPSVLTSVTIPNTVVSIEAGAFSYGTYIQEIIVSGSNNSYSSENGVLFNKNKTILVDYPQNRQAQEYIIPSSVTTIGSYSFFKASLLKRLTIPSSVTTIQLKAFEDMSSLGGVLLPSSVQSLGNDVFLGCSSLKSIFVQRASSLGVTTAGTDFVTNTHTSLRIYVESTSTASYQAATNWSAYSTVIHSESIIYDGYAVLDFSTGVEIIQYLGVEDCVHIPETINSKNVLKVGDYAFYNNDNLKHVTIPEPVESVGNFAFNSCVNSSFARLYRTASMINFGTDAFGNSHPSFKIYTPQALLASYIAQTNLVDYTDMMFSESIIFGDYSISTVTGGVSILQYLGESTSVIIPATLNSLTVVGIGDFAFLSQNSLLNITLNSTITSIGEKAFKNCTNLQKIILPSSVESIGNEAFYECNSLNIVSIERDNTISITTGGLDMFHGVPVSFKIYVPANSLSAYQTETNWSGYSASIISKATIFGDYSVVDVTNGVSILQYLGADETVIVPNTINGKTVLEIGNYAFASLHSTKNITIPATVTSIGAYCFENDDILESVTILRDNTVAITSGGMDMFLSTSTGLKIYVPTNSVNAYRTATNWMVYLSKIFGIP